MSDENLRLEAVVTDRFSKPLSDLKKQLAGVKGPNLSSSQREFQRFHEEVKRSSVALKDGLGGAMDGLGLRSAAAVLSLAGVVAAVRKVAGAAKELRSLSRETGISTKNLQILQQSAERLGSNSGAMSEGLKQFKSNIYDVRRGVSELIPDLTRLDPSGGLLDALKSDDLNKSLDVTLEYLGKLNKVDPEAAGRLSEKLFGSRDFSRIMQNPEHAAKVFAEVSKRVREVTAADEAAAQAFEDSTAKMQAAAEKLGKTIGRDMIGPMTTLIEKMNEVVEGGEKVAKFVDGLFGGKSVGDAASDALGPLNRPGVEMTEERKKELLEKRKRGELPDATVKAKPSGNPLWWDALKDLGLAVGDRGKAPGASDEAARKGRDAIREGAKKGVEEGMRATIEKMAFQATPGEARVWNAAFGGGGGLWGANGPYGGGGGWSPEPEVDDRRAAPQPRPEPPQTRRAGEPEGPPMPGAPTPPDRVPPAVDPGRMGGPSAGRRAAEEIRRKVKGAHYRLSDDQRAEMAHAIRKTAGDLGISPEHLAAIMSFETGGTLDPWKKGPTTKWGTHRGLIQWGEPQARKYGVGPDTSITDQVAAVGRYLRDRGVKPGMGLENVYGAVIAGSATKNLDVADANGTTARSGSRRMWETAHRYALQNLERNTAASPAFPKDWRERAGGSAFDAARGAGAFGVTGPELRGRAALDVHVKSDGRANVKADGGDLFQDVRVNRGRSMSPAIDA